jgi:hypothetical protein
MTLAKERVKMKHVIRLLRLNQRAKPEPVGKAGAKAEFDPLLAFAAEGASKVEPAIKNKSPTTAQTGPAALASGPGGLRLRVQWPAWASTLVAAVAVGGLIWVYPRLIPVDAAAPRSAQLTIFSQPAGAEVLVDGVSRGVSPLSLSVASGSHTVTLRHGAAERVLPLTLSPGAEVTHHIELRAPDMPSASAGGLTVVTDPPGAQVQLDGRNRGVSPLTLTDLGAADYSVRVSGPTGSAERTVTVKAGVTASVVFSLPRVSSPLAGWLTVSAPFDIQVSEAGNVIGTGRTAKIMLPAGRHSLALANEALQYSAERTVDVVAGQTAALSVDAPRVPISANARPWADVIIDGTNVGQTPIANLETTIGTHEVVFRHPQLGDRRQTVVVTSNGPNRIAVDLTK